MNDEEIDKDIRTRHLCAKHKTHEQDQEMNMRDRNKLQEKAESHSNVITSCVYIIIIACIIVDRCRRILTSNLIEEEKKEETKASIKN